MMRVVTLFALIIGVQLVTSTGSSLGLSRRSFSEGLNSMSRISRQVNRADFTKCVSVLYRAQCSTSYAQNYINTISQCGLLGNTVAIGIESSCHQNEAGEFCGAALVANDIIQIETHCRSASCSAECRSSLQTIKNDAGCCLDSVYVLKALFYSNFSNCGISYPSACRPTSLDIPTPSNDPSCGTNGENIEKINLQFFCSSKNIQPVLNTLNSNNCQEVARLIELSCSYRNGNFCVEEISELNSDFITNAITNCPFISNCSMGCSSSINTLKANLGCCLNIFNSSLSLARDLFSTSTEFDTVWDNSLWQQCNIMPPGDCETKILDAALSAYSAGNTALLILAAAGLVILIDIVGL